MDIIHFQDIKTIPDIVHTYTNHLRETATPIVINNGSYQCRVGWASQPAPVLQFKNQIAKPRKERSKKDNNAEVPQTPQLQVGNNIVNIEAVRFQLKTPFDRNVVTHFEAQEHLLDYAFTHLGVDTDSCVPHPIVMTEPFLNPNSSRNIMSELLFECYEVPAVAYGIDSIYSYTNTIPATLPLLKRDALVVTLGYHTVHVIPILGGQVQYERARRLNTGGYHVISFLHRILQLKYPAHANSITLSRAEELVRNICAVAIDYDEELSKWTDPDYYEANIRRIQLPYVQNVSNALTAEQQKERKRELARRLTEINARKREERLAEDEDKLALYRDLTDLRHDDPEEFDRLLTEHNLRSGDDLQRGIGLLVARIEKTRQKIVAAAAAAAAAASGQEDGLVQVEEQVVVAAGGGAGAKQPRYSKVVFESEKAMHVFLLNAKKMKQEIMTKKASRKQRKQDMAKRRTAAGQERMRIISQLARKEKGNDDFGLRDEDWDIYKTISRDGGDSDSETENEKLLELDEIIKAHEPQPYGYATGSTTGSITDDSTTTTATTSSSSTHLHTTAAAMSSAEQYQLHIGVERYRAPELLFKPYMLGSMEAGVTEVIAFVLARFTAEEQLRLAANVLLDGGVANLPGLGERLAADLRAIRPFESFYKVTIVNDPSLSSWCGARKFANSPEFDEGKITKNDYLEYGGAFNKPHFSANLYTPSPKEIILEIDL